MVITVVAHLISKNWRRSVLAGYVFLIIAVTILSRTPGTKMNYELEIFWSHRVWSIQREQIIANVIMFIPVGVLAGKDLDWKILPGSTCFSFLIEFTQLITRRGLFEFDDIIHNTLGSFIGFLIFLVAKRLYVYYEDKKR